MDGSAAAQADGAGVWNRAKWTGFSPWFDLQPGPDDYFVVAVYSRRSRMVGLAISYYPALAFDELTRAVQDAVGGPQVAVRWRQCYAGDIVELQWKDVGQVWRVLNALLHAGYNVLTQTNYPVFVRCERYAATTLLPPSPLTPETLERRHIAALLEAPDAAARDRQLTNAMQHARSWYTDADAWITSEGKAFVDFMSRRELNAASVA